MYCLLNKFIQGYSWINQAQEVLGFGRGENVQGKNLCQCLSHSLHFLWPFFFLEVVRTDLFLWSKMIVLVHCSNTALVCQHLFFLDKVVEDCIHVQYVDLCIQLTKIHNVINCKNLFTHLQVTFIFFCLGGSFIYILKDSSCNEEKL